MSSAASPTVMVTPLCLSSRPSSRTHANANEPFPCEQHAGGAGALLRPRGEQEQALALLGPLTCSLASPDKGLTFFFLFLQSRARDQASIPPTHLLLSFSPAPVHLLCRDQAQIVQQVPRER